MKRVNLETVGVCTTSVGDVAIALATIHALGKRGVIVLESAQNPDPNITTVVGGGHLLTADPSLKKLQSYRVPGAHLLNAVGVRVHESLELGFDYLMDYRYLSVRDGVSKTVLERSLKQSRDIHLVPDPAMLLKPTPMSIVSRLPGMEWLEREKDFVCVHAVDDIPKLKNLPSSAIAVETQPWLQRGETFRWRSVPRTHSPEIISGIVSQASKVVTRSLHLAIFALTNAIPFCCIVYGKDPQSEKLRNYFMRAGFEECLYSGDDPVRYIETNIPDNKLELVRKSEVQRCERHFDRLVKNI
jgi:hypothetical protein